MLAVALATLLGNVGLRPRVEDAARDRLARAAMHMAEVTAAVYLDEDGFTPNARRTIRHLAALDDVRLTVRPEGGAAFSAGRPAAGARASAAVEVGSRRVATVTVSSQSGALLTPDEEHLRHSLNRLHLIAGAVAIVAALLIALVLAETLSRPLRRIRAGAERLERGDLATRVDISGDSEVRAVGRALNRLAETLEHEEEIRKTSVADLGHELRTPVNGLLARIEAAQDRVLTGPENLQAMHDEARRLTRLLDDLSTLADAERPGLLLDKHPLDLAALAERAAASFAPRFAEAGIDFRTELDPVFVSGDAKRLEQVAANLLANALRYTEPGGAITLRVGPEDGHACLVVDDSGIGIASDDLRHIFTRFWRGDPSRSRATGGSGIGLAIVRELVRAHDGRVDVDSVLGQGSRFRVVLPATQAPKHSHRLAARR